jgi:hypothetical protein
MVGGYAALSEEARCQVDPVLEAHDCLAPLQSPAGDPWVPWDNHGTSVYESDFFDFGRLRFLEPGSIPAASTSFLAISVTYV